MMDIDKSGPKSITYRKFDGFQNAAVLYTNVSRSAVRKDRYFMQIGSYPGPNTGTSVGTRTQVGNGFTMAYSDTLGNIKWTKRLDFPDTNIFWSQNFYSVRYARRRRYLGMQLRQHGECLQPAGIQPVHQDGQPSAMG